MTVAGIAVGMASVGAEISDVKKSHAKTDRNTQNEKEQTSVQFLYQSITIRSQAERTNKLSSPG